MKKIIGIIFISLMFCNIGFADIYMKDGKHFEERLYQYNIVIFLKSFRSK